MTNETNDLFWSLLAKKLSEEATPEELRELHFILLKNPNLQHHADLLGEMWQQHLQTNITDCEAAYMRHVMKHKDELFTEEQIEEINTPESALEDKPGFIKSLVSKRKLTVFSFAALLVVTSGSFYFFSNKNKIDSPMEQSLSSVVTKNGNRSKLVLPDGSEVWLNAGSKLDYNNSDFNKEMREVTLNGEAYFDVTKNSEKPFIIHTKKMDIKVIGTAFNVRSYSNEKVAEASLIRGTIEVTLKDRKDQKIVLKPNEKISIANEEPAELKINSGQKVALKNATPVPLVLVKELKTNPVTNILPEIAWTQNRLYFEDESLEDIAPMIERWFGKNVIIQSDALKRIRYTGNFENEAIENVLSYLKLSRPFNFKIENDTVTIY